MYVHAYKTLDLGDDHQPDPACRYRGLQEHLSNGSIRVNVSRCVEGHWQSLTRGNKKEKNPSKDKAESNVE